MGWPTSLHSTSLKHDLIYLIGDKVWRVIYMARILHDHLRNILILNSWKMWSQSKMCCNCHTMFDSHAVRNRCVTQTSSGRIRSYTFRLHILFRQNTWTWHEFIIIWKWKSTWNIRFDFHMHVLLNSIQSSLSMKLFIFTFTIWNWYVFALITAFNPNGSEK